MSDIRGSTYIILANIGSIVHDTKVMLVFQVSIYVKRLSGHSLYKIFYNKLTMVVV